MAPRPRSSYYRPRGRSIGASQSSYGGPSRGCFFRSYRQGCGYEPQGPRSWAAFREVWRGPCREFARCRGRLPRQEGAGVLQITGGECGPKGRLCVDRLAVGRTTAKRGGNAMRVDRATLTAWLRPIERAPPGAQLCFGSFTIRSRSRAGPALVSENRDTKSKKILFSKPAPPQAGTDGNPQGQGGPCGKRAAFSMRGNLARSSGSRKSWLT